MFGGEHGWNAVLQYKFEMCAMDYSAMIDDQDCCLLGVSRLLSSEIKADSSCSPSHVFSYE